MARPPKNAAGSPDVAVDAAVPTDAQETPAIGFHDAIEKVVVEALANGDHGTHAILDSIQHLLHALRLKVVDAADKVDGDAFAIIAKLRALL